MSFLAWEEKKETGSFKHWMCVCVCVCVCMSLFEVNKEFCYLLTVSSNSFINKLKEVSYCQETFF